MAANDKFLVKLFDLLASGESQDIIRWKDEDRLVILDTQQLMGIVNARGISSSPNYDSFGKLMRNYTFNVDKECAKTPGIAYEQFWKSPVVNRSTSREGVVEVQSRERPKREKASGAAAKQKTKSSGVSGKERKKKSPGKTKATKVAAAKPEVQPYQNRKQGKRGRSASDAPYNLPSDSGHEEGGPPSSPPSSSRGSRSPSASCPDLTYSDREDDSPPSSPPLLAALYDASTGSRDSELSLDMLEPLHTSDYASPSLPLVAKEVLVDELSTLFDDELYHLRERDGILSHGPSNAVRETYGSEAAEDEASSVKAITGGDAMWGYENSPREANSFVPGWWDYDEWDQDWGRVERPDVVEPHGWY